MKQFILLGLFFSSCFSQVSCQRKNATTVQNNSAPHNALLVTVPESDSSDCSPSYSKENNKIIISDSLYWNCKKDSCKVSAYNITDRYDSITIIKDCLYIPILHPGGLRNFQIVGNGDVMKEGKATKLNLFLYHKCMSLTLMNRLFTKLRFDLTPLQQKGTNCILLNIESNSGNNYSKKILYCY